MKKISISIFLFTIFAFFILSKYISLSPPQLSNTSLPSMIPSITNAVLGVTTGKCHAVRVDAFDPQAWLPDLTCTPGTIDHAVTQENLNDTICKSGYTQTVRPPTSYTNNLKKQQIEDYGYEDTDMRNYEEDHLISLELGGSPRDPQNLWPEPHSSLNEKDKVENYLHSQICSGMLTLIQAQQEITNNWYEMYKQIR